MVKTTFLYQSLFPFLEERAASPQGCRGGGLHAHPGAHEGAASTILEQRDIEVTLENKDEIIDDIIEEANIPDTFYKGITLRCNCWFCEKCRLSKGIQLRERILAKAHMFKVPRLYTITVNREWFDSPQAAYEYVMGKKFIARLLTKELKVRRWFWVLEPQEANGEGWPHWHLLIDVGDMPGVWYHKNSKTTSEEKPENLSGWCYIPHFFDLNRVHHLLEKWKIGKQCKLSVRKDSFNNPEHAIRYITKYLIKMPRRGFPPWMLNFPRLSFYQPSKDIGSLGGVNTPKKKKDDSEPKRENAFSRPPVDRVSECRKKMIFMTYDQAKDKYHVKSPIFALKESIPLFSGSVCYDDFDFTNQRTFKVYGFTNYISVLAFTRKWQHPLVAERIEQKIEEKRKRLLEQWEQAVI